MKASIELTFSPLQDDYESLIIKFIHKLRSSGFDIKENPLSTQLYGDFQPMMEFLTEAIEEVFTDAQAALIYMKIVKGDRKDYTPHF